VRRRHGSRLRRPPSIASSSAIPARERRPSPGSWQILAASAISTRPFVEVDRAGSSPASSVNAIKTQGAVASAWMGAVHRRSLCPRSGKRRQRFWPRSHRYAPQADEDNRDRLCVIVAVHREMRRSGRQSRLRSRFTRTIRFADYSGHELATIARGWRTAAASFSTPRRATRSMTLARLCRWCRPQFATPRVRTL